jgi:hypothetical protein
MLLVHKPKPQVVRPFTDAVFADIQSHVRELRRLFDWPGIPYHDADHHEDNKFNRWYMHNAPVLRHLHINPEFVAFASKLAKQPLQASYCFLSMYGPEGICPKHTDRPQCQFTIDLCVNQDSPWPIYVEEKSYLLKPGQALFYSGTGQEHYRKSMSEDSKATYCDLVFFHFAPATWQGKLS